MRIVVISDTHRSYWTTTKIIQEVKKSDMLIHLGDNVIDIEDIRPYYSGPIINVRGNCDFVKTTPSEQIINIGELKVFITHGSNYAVKYDLMRLKYRAEELGVDMVLYGHTHVSNIDFEEGIWFINPGSPILPRDGQESIAIIEIEGTEIRPSIVPI